MKLLFNLLLALVAIVALGGIGGYFYARRAFAPPANQLSVAGLPVHCRFAWQADTTATPAVAHAALLVPIRLAGCARTCYLQFDTGAPYTLFYANPLAALRQAYPAASLGLQPQHDTLRNVQFTLGNGQVLVRRAPVLRYGGRTLLPDTTAPLIVGSLGADVLARQVLVLDYPRQRFTLYARLPDSLTRRTHFTELDFSNRRVLVRARVQDDEQKFMFDSGSSAFSLLTSQARWQALAVPAATPRVSGVNSWGKTLMAHTAASAAVMRVGQQPLPLRTVTYIDNVSFWQRALMQVSGMGGMLGNAPFVGHAIVLDAPGGRFGVLQP